MSAVIIKALGSSSDASAAGVASPKSIFIDDQSYTTGTSGAAVTTGGTAIISAVAGKRIRLINVRISSDTATSLRINSVTSDTTLYVTPKLLADTPFQDQCGYDAVAELGEAVEITAGANATITGTIGYCVI